MNRFNLLFTSLLFTAASFGQKSYTPSVEYCDCAFKVDSSFLQLVQPQYRPDYVFQLRADSTLSTRCGYLFVPENRQKKNSRMIKLPFIITSNKNNANRQPDPVLFTSGGPGNSSLSWINGQTAKLLSADRDCIAFEQRGTRFAIPHLRTLLLDSVMRVAYRKNLPKDSMWMVGVKLYKKELIRKSIDINAYNTDATVQDIGDLIKALHIDSINLFGGSYSGGLVTAVAQQFPGKVRSLVLDSPLPTFSPVDEDEHRHFIEALHVLSERAKRDSVSPKYANVEQQFHAYFKKIIDSVFILRMTDPVTQEPLAVEYTKVELLDIIVNAILDRSQLKAVPDIILDITSGNHEKYVLPKIKRKFTANTHPDGMRMLVYCADATGYHDEKVIAQMFQLYPYLEGYHINDVWKPVCDCWANPSISPETKKHFYSAIPMLVADGAMDAACSPRYMLELKHYFINAQAFLFTNMSHGVGSATFASMMQQFLNDPLKPVAFKDEHVVLMER
jgi:pimeloyl-ACP methyl ester carboxylesterase